MSGLPMRKSSSSAVLKAVGTTIGGHKSLHSLHPATAHAALAEVGGDGNNEHMPDGSGAPEAREGLTGGNATSPVL